jgi:hypothetical protein
MSNTRRTRPPAGAAAAGLAAGTPEDETPEDRSFEFCGEQFRFADKFAHFAIMRLQRFADTADPRAMAAVYDVLETSIHPDDWMRFQDVAVASRADDDELAEVLAAAARQLGTDVTRREQAQRRAIPQDHKPPARPRQPRRPA